MMKHRWCEAFHSNLEGHWIWPPPRTRSYSTFLDSDLPREQTSTDLPLPPAARRTAELAARFLMRLGGQSEDLAKWAADPDSGAAAPAGALAKSSRTSLLRRWTQFEGQGGDEPKVPEHKEKSPAEAYDPTKLIPQADKDTAGKAAKAADTANTVEDPAKALLAEQDPAKALAEKEYDPAKALAEKEADGNALDAAKLAKEGSHEEPEATAKLEAEHGNEAHGKAAKEDPLTDVVVDPESGDILDGKTGQAIDPLSGEVVEDGSYIDDDTGLAVDPYKGKIYDPLTGQGND